MDRLAKTVEAAEAQRRDYYRAVSDRAKLRNALPFILIPLSAIALYRGITTNTDAGKRNVLEFGLIGAAIYGTGGFYLSAPRERIYLSGVLALGCAIHSVEPYLVSGQDYSNFKANRLGLDEAIEQVVQLRNDVLEAAKPLSGSSANVLLAQSQPAVAQALVVRARQVAEAARTLDAQMNNASSDLRWTVEKIVNQVDVQISATDQDPSAILKVIGNLPTLGASLANVSALRLSAVGAQASNAAQGTGNEEAFRAEVLLIQKLNELADASNRLMSLMSSVASFTNTVLATAKNASKLDSCTVANIANELIVSPSGDSVTMTIGVATVFRVRGTSGIPDAAIVGPSGSAIADAVKIIKSVEGNVLVVKAVQENKVDGLAQVTLEFSANDQTIGTRKQVTLHLDSGAAKKPAAETPAQKPAVTDSTVGPQGADPKSDFETKTLTVGTVKQVQAKLGVSAIGIIGPRTRAAVRKFQTANGGGAAANGVLTLDWVDKINKSSAQPPPAAATGDGKPAAQTLNPKPAADDNTVGPQGAQGDYESKALTIGLLRKIQTKLRISAVSGVFDKETRVAIRQYQSSMSGGKEVSGILTPDLADRILMGN